MTKENLKSKTLLFILSIFLCITFLLSGCSDRESTLTDAEVIAETKNYLNEKFDSGYVYSSLYLPLTHTVNNKYKTYISWTSSNNSIINATSGNVNRTLNSQSCTLTARIMYKEIEESLKIYLIIPANKYECSYPTFYPNSTTQFQFQVAYFAYNTDNTVTIDLYFYNNLDSQKTIYGIQKAIFAIYKDSSTIIGGNDYFTKSLVYSNSKSKQFTCKYHEYVKISLGTISASNISKYTLYKNTVIKVGATGTISYTSN